MDVGSAVVQLQRFEDGPLKVYVRYFHPCVPTVCFFLQAICNLEKLGDNITATPRVKVKLGKEYRPL